MEKFPSRPETNSSFKPEGNSRFKLGPEAMLDIQNSEAMGLPSFEEIEQLRMEAEAKRQAEIRSAEQDINKAYEVTTDGAFGLTHEDISNLSHSKEVDEKIAQRMKSYHDTMGQSGFSPSINATPSFDQRVEASRNNLSKNNKDNADYGSTEEEINHIEIDATRKILSQDQLAEWEKFSNNVRGNTQESINNFINTVDSAAGEFLFGKDENGKFDWGNPKDYARFIANLPSSFLTALPSAFNNSVDVFSGTEMVKDEAGNYQPKKLNTIQIVGKAVDTGVTVGGMFFGGSGTLLKSVGGKVGQQLIQEAGKRGAKEFVKNIAKNALEEGVEELVQSVAQDFGDDGELNTPLEQYRDSFLLGGLGGGVMSAGGEVVGGVKTKIAEMSTKSNVDARVDIDPSVVAETDYFAIMDEDGNVINQSESRGVDNQNTEYAPRANLTDGPNQEAQTLTVPSVDSIIAEANSINTNIDTEANPIQAQESQVVVDVADIIQEAGEIVIENDANIVRANEGEQVFESINNTLDNQESGVAMQEGSQDQWLDSAETTDNISVENAEFVKNPNASELAIANATNLFAELSELSPDDPKTQEVYKKYIDKLDLSREGLMIMFGEDIVSVMLDEQVVEEAEKIKRILTDEPNKITLLYAFVSRFGLAKNQNYETSAKLVDSLLGLVESDFLSSESKDPVYSLFSPESRSSMSPEIANYLVQTAAESENSDLKFMVIDSFSDDEQLSVVLSAGEKSLSLKKISEIKELKPKIQEAYISRLCDLSTDIKQKVGIATSLSKEAQTAYVSKLEIDDMATMLGAEGRMLDSLFGPDFFSTYGEKVSQFDVGVKAMLFEKYFSNIDQVIDGETNIYYAMKPVIWANFIESGVISEDVWRKGGEIFSRQVAYNNPELYLTSDKISDEFRNPECEEIACREMAHMEPSKLILSMNKFLRPENIPTAISVLIERGDIAPLATTIMTPYHTQVAKSFVGNWHSVDSGGDFMSLQNFLIENYERDQNPDHPFSKDETLYKSFLVNKSSFGPYGGPTTIEIISKIISDDILDSDIAKDLRVIGVTERGEAGVEQLKRATIKIRDELTNGYMPDGDVDGEVVHWLRESEYAQRLMSNLVGKSEGNYGSNGNRVIQEFARNINFEKARLDEAFSRHQSSGVVYVSSKKDIKNYENFNNPEGISVEAIPGESARMSYNTFVRDIEEVRALTDGSERATNRFETMLDAIESVIEDGVSEDLRLLSKFTQIEFDQSGKPIIPSYGREAVTAYLEQAGRLDEYSRDGIFNESSIKPQYDQALRRIGESMVLKNKVGVLRQDKTNNKLDGFFTSGLAGEIMNQKRLINHSATAEIIRQLGLARTIGSHEVVVSLNGRPSAVSLADLSFSEAKVYSDDLLMIKQVVEKTGAELFSGNKKQMTEWKKQHGFVGLDDADGIMRSNKQLKKSVGLQFSATKGMGLELSGLLADACWADKYASISGAFPNITGVIIEQNTDGLEANKLAGSFLVIETNKSDGSPILVIRGLNPKETFINSIDTGQFVRAAYEYVAKIAELKGADVGIVLSDSHQKAASNREAIVKWENTNLMNSTKVKVDPASSTFNGYNLNTATESNGFLGNHVVLVDERLLRELGWDK